MDEALDATVKHLSQARANADTAQIACLYT